MKLFSLLAESRLIKDIHSLSLEDSEAKRVFSFFIFLLIQFFLWGMITYMFRRIKRKIVLLKRTKLKTICIHEYELIDPDKQVALLIYLANLFRWILFGSQFLIAILILFSIFPETKNLAALLFSYIWKPIKVIGGGIVNYIPNLFTIIVIVLVLEEEQQI